MKVSIELDTTDLTPYDVAWTLHNLASKFARNQVTSVGNVRGPFYDDVGTVVIT